MLDQIMKDKGFTNKSFAEATGISQRTIEAYRSGRREPSLSTGLRIADVLGVDPHEILKSE